MRRAADCRQIGAAAQAGRAEVGPAVGSLAGRAGGRVAYRLPAASSALRAASRRLDCPDGADDRRRPRAALRRARRAGDNPRMKLIRLREGRDRSLLRRHPWVFEGGIASGRADAGETVRVQAADGRFLAWAAYSPQSSIRLRAWSFDEAERIDAAFFERRIARAVALRARLAVPSDGVRLVHGEADGLPGLIVDRYGESTLVAQFLAAGAERWKPAIADALLRVTGAARLYERSDASVRALEGLPEVAGWLRGDGPTVVQVAEHGLRYEVDIAQGHKTGFYLDQRDSRRRFAEVVRHYGVRTVLNCYAYTGGFSVTALAGGAERVTSVDSSAPALRQAEANVRLNGFGDTDAVGHARMGGQVDADPSGGTDAGPDAGAGTARHRTLDADVNATLRAEIARGAAYDAIVLDPPKFAPTAAHAERAARAYKDINRLALQLLAPGGVLFTFSCSGGIGAELFHKIVAGAAMDAGVDGVICERLGAAPDHPMTLAFPEGEYLKGLMVLKAA